MTRDRTPTDKEVISDVQEISFTDDMAAPGYFEFVLHDWDPVEKATKYSSPWDATGQPRKLADGSSLPIFEPGEKVSLSFGYIEDGLLPIMEGEIVSLSPSFPASGLPTVRVRALDAAYRKLQRIHIEAAYDGTSKEIATKLCTENGYSARWDDIENEGKAQQKVAIEGNLYDALLAKAKEYGMYVTVPAAKAGETQTIIFSKLASGQDAAVVEFVWGRTLLSFVPVMSTASLVSEVVARGSDPDAKGKKKEIVAVKKWSDLNWVDKALGPGGAAGLEAAGSGFRETIKPDGIRTQEDADKAAIARLTEMANSLITGSGTAIGLPELRAGKTISIKGLGARFDGIYRMTQTTHTIGGSGYGTSFQVRKEVLK
ncbi:MAG: phage late control D family protein [Allorhizobium sp.]